MTADLEQLLRSTLDNRAATVTSGPEWTTPTAPTAPHRRRPPTWVAGLAAAAAVAAVAVGAVTISGNDGENRPATQPPTTGQPTPRTSSSVPVPPAPAGKSCATTLPSAWTDAMRGSGVDLGADQVTPLTVGTDGTVVALRDAGPEPGTPREVVLLAPDGGAPRTVYRVADPDRYSVQSAQLYQHWLVLAVTRAPRPPAGTIPGSSPMPNVHTLTAINLDTEDTVAIAAGDGGTYIDGATVLDGRVYWDERSRYGAPTATVRSYGLKTREYRTQFNGEAPYLLMNATGVYDGATVIASIDLPAPVSAAVDGAARRVVTDGTAFAWGDGQTRIGWWRPGMSAPMYRTVPRSALDFDDNSTGGLSVSGQYVLTEPIVPSVLDMTTGAIAPIPGSARLFGAQARAQFDYYAGNGITVGAVYYGEGHYVGGYWTDGSQRLLRLDLGSLPELTC